MLTFVSVCPLLSQMVRQEMKIVLDLLYVIVTHYIIVFDYTGPSESVRNLFQPV